MFTTICYCTDNDPEETVRVLSNSGADDGVIRTYFLTPSLHIDAMGKLFECKLFQNFHFIKEKLLQSFEEESRADPRSNIRNC